MEYKGKSVLVVDDDVDLLEQISAQLRSLGFEILAAETQQRAEELLAEHKPDLAVIDLMLEHEDSGFVLAYQIKKKSASIPVVLVTAVSTEHGFDLDAATDEERRWIKADAFLNKPVRFEQLKTEIRRLLPA